MSFQTPFERAAFSGYANGQTKDATAVLLSMSASPAADQTRWNEQLTRCLNSLHASGNLSKKNDKKIKYIYQQVHNQFLTEYRAENRFHEIIHNGYYNCVTATALYALVFEKLAIPYSIQEKPTHVYLIAYPGRENILVESTSPASGFLSFDPAFKSNYVKVLKEQKIIGPAEATSQNTDELFNKYYFSDEDITLEQLLGIHYANDALFKQDRNDWVGAHEQIKKSYWFYPSPRSEFLLTRFAVQRLAEEKKPLSRATLIGQLARFEKAGISADMIKGEFSNLTLDVLLKNNEKDVYEKCYAEVIRQIDVPELKKEIAYIYFYENGRVYHNQGNHVRAKHFFGQALAQQPNNADLGGIFVNSLVQSFRNERNNRAVIDSLDRYQAKHPALRENSNFNSFLAFTCIRASGDAFHSGDAATGEKYQKRFEELHAADPSLNVVQQAVGYGYSEACVYYFKRGQKTKAKLALDKGLQFAPDDFQLKMRKQMIQGG